MKARIRLALRSNTETVHPLQMLVRSRVLLFVKINVLLLLFGGFHLA